MNSLTQNVNASCIVLSQMIWWTVHEEVFCVSHPILGFIQSQALEEDSYYLGPDKAGLVSLSDRFATT